MMPLLALLHCFQQHTAWINLFFLSAFTITFFSFILYRNKAAANLPPSPPRLPLIGNLHQLGSLPHRSLREFSKKYGQLMLFHFGCVPTIIVSSAEMAREVMKTHDQVFASRPPSSIVKRLVYDSKNVAFSPYGEYWRHARRICVDHLLSIKRVQSFQSVKEEEVSLLVEKINESCLGLVNLSDMIMNLTIDIICRAALGRKYSGEEGSNNNRFHDMIVELVALLRSFPARDYIPWLGWLDTLSGLDARVRNNFKQLDSFLERVVEEHLHAKRYASNNQKECMDFVDILLSLKDKDDTLNRDNMKGIILDMFSGGTHTTFRVLESMMAELIKHPNTMDRVQEEVRGVVGTKGKITEEDLDKMNYMKAVIKETLRLHPPIPFLVHRETMEDINLRGYDIPAGTRVIVNAWAIGREPKSWDKPDEFWPDRFINTSADFKGQNFQSVPFGAGRRGCPGVGFAMSTIELTVANLLHHFDWEMPDGMKREVREMSESLGSAVHKKSSLILVAKPRLP